MNNSNLALFAGLIASDGHLDRDYHGIRLITSNKEFLETRILKLFKSSSLKIWKTRSGFGKERYVLYLYDKKLKHLLENKYGIPRGKKSENIDMPKKINFHEKISFIRGLFSGDGSISVDTKGEKIYPQIIFWTKSKKLAISLKQFLDNLGIISRFNYTKSKDQYRLSIRDKNSLMLFKNKIGFVHPDKQRRLESFKL